MFLQKINKKRGFTLIELLVVIAIISLLSSVVLASVTSARDKARLLKFNQEIKSFQTAIEIYKTSNDGNYPPTMQDSDTISSTLTFLKNLNLLSSDTINLPSDNLYTPETYLVNSGYFVTCGSPENSGKDWTVAMNILDASPDFQIPGFSPLYSEGSLIPYYICVEI